MVSFVDSQPGFSSCEFVEPRLRLSHLFLMGPSELCRWHIQARYGPAWLATNWRVMWSAGRDILPFLILIGREALRTYNHSWTCFAA